MRSTSILVRSSRSPVAIATAALTMLAAHGHCQRFLKTRDGAKPGDQLGTRLCAIGDVDTDGVGDLAAIADPIGSPSLNYVEVLSGRTLRVLHSFGGSTAEPPFAVAGPGDLDGDGVPDVVVGVWTTGVGFVDVYSGKTGARIRRVQSTVGGFGADVCALGDVNGDGVPDFAALGQQVYTVSGKDGAILRTSNVQGGAGHVIARGGDVDGDGVDDVLVGDHDLGFGRVLVLSGRTGAQLQQVAATRSSLFGSAMVDVGDVDADGRDDFAVTAPADALVAGSGITNGSVSLVSGRTGGIIRTLWADAYAGGTIARLDDLDADGVPELLLGRKLDRGSTASGGIQILSGLSGRTLLRLADPWPWASTEASAFGMSLDTLGDVDGDGIVDFAVGAPSFNGTARQQGRIVVVSGRIYAAADVVPVNCSGSTQLPGLDSTRPVLGLTATLVGTNAPGVVGHAFVGAPVPRPVNLGFVGCDLHFDPSTAAVLFRTTAASNWQQPVPLPNLQALVGFTVNLQVLYGPTRGPLGFDLSNALVWRLGY